MKRIDEEKLKSSMALIFNVATSLDAYLLNNHIGSFEELMYFHKLKDSLKGTQRLDEYKHLAKNLRIKFNGQGPDRNYCRDLVKYYHAI